MLTAPRTPYSRSLIGLTLALAVSAPLAADIGGAQSTSLRDMADRVLKPGALAAEDPKRSAD